MYTYRFNTSFSFKVRLFKVLLQKMSFLYTSSVPVMTANRSISDLNFNFFA